MRQEEHGTAIAAFIRSNGITRCPTAYVLLTEDGIALADRTALTDYTAARGRARLEKTADRERAFAGCRVAARSGE